MGRVLAILGGDVRNILRDRMLAVMPAVPFLAATALRFLFPFACGVLEPLFDMRPYEPYLGAFFLLLGPTMFGFVAAFLFLDEREAGLPAAFAVTPLGFVKFAALRLCFAAGLSLVATLGAWPILGVGAPPLPEFLAAALLAACCSPGIACFILAFARNKVEGLTISKLAGFSLLAPFATAAVPAPWNRIVAVFPTWWSAAAFVGRPKGGLEPTAALIGGAAVCAAWIAVFGVRASRRLHG